MRISADYYAISGATVSYFGSMRVDAPIVSITASHVVIKGIGRYTWAAGAPRVKVTIPRVPFTRHLPRRRCSTSSRAAARGPPTSAATSGSAFRAMVFEQDCQDTVPAPFTSYNTGSLPSGGPARTLSVVTAYAEAGVQVLTTGANNVISTAEAGANAAWSDAELHAAMIRHFSRWREVPQWAVWLFHAQAARHRHRPVRDHVRPAGQAAARVRGLLRGHRRHDGGCPPAAGLHLRPRARALLQPAPLVAEVARDSAAAEPAGLAVVDELSLAVPGRGGRVLEAFPFRFDARSSCTSATGSRRT